MYISYHKPHESWNWFNRILHEGLGKWVPEIFSNVSTSRKVSPQTFVSEVPIRVVGCQPFAFARPAPLQSPITSSVPVLLALHTDDHQNLVVCSQASISRRLLPSSSIHNSLSYCPSLMVKILGISINSFLQSQFWVPLRPSTSLLFTIQWSPPALAELGREEVGRSAGVGGRGVTAGAINPGRMYEGKTSEEHQT